MASQKKRPNLRKWQWVIPILVAFIGAAAIIIAALIKTPSPIFVPVKVTPAPTVTTPPPPPPPPALVQKNTSQPGAITPNTVTFSNPVNAGDLIIVAITQDETTIIDKPTDNVGNIYTPVQTGAALYADRSLHHDYIELYYAKNVTGGNITVTVNFTTPADQNAGDSNVGIYEFSGLDNTSPLGPVTALYGSGNRPDGGTLTTVQDYEVMFVVGVDRGLDNTSDPNINTPVSPGKGHQLLDQQDNSVDYERFYAEYQIVSPGTYHTDFSLKYSTNWAVIGAIFKP